MLPEKYAALATKILALCLVAALSFFVAARVIPKTHFVESSMESLNESSDTVMRLSAGTLSMSLAISALPDDFGTPLADTLADMNVYFIVLLAILFLEKILIQFGIPFVFRILIPVACGLWGAYKATNKEMIRSLAIRLCVLGLAVAFVVPCSTHIANIVSAEMTNYVEETIAETEGGANKLDEAMESEDADQSIFDKLSELFQSAIDGISDLMQYIQNTIRRCMNSIAIMILTTFIMPLLTLFFLRWILKELFQIVIPLPPVRRHGHIGRGPDHEDEDMDEAEPAAIGE